MYIGILDIQDVHVFAVRRRKHEAATVFVVKKAERGFEVSTPNLFQSQENVVENGATEEVNA